MRLKANLRHDNAKKPEQLSEREWTLFIADVIFFPEGQRVMFNTGIHLDPPAGFRIIIEPHPSLTYYDLVHMNRVKELTPGNEMPVLLVMAEFISEMADDRPVRLPDVGDPVAVIRLERLSEVFTIECGEKPDKELTTISNFN